MSAHGKSFRDLAVWQRSITLSTEIYRLAHSFPAQERYGLTSQMCRAAVSIPSNIAEGHGRGSRREFRNFVRIAQGSSNELQTQLVIAQHLGYSNPEHLKQAEAETIEIARMLNGLISFLTRRIQLETTSSLITKY